MQMKTTRYHLTPVRTAGIKKKRDNKCWQGYGAKGEFLHTVGGDVNWYSHCGKWCGVLQKI